MDMYSDRKKKIQTSIVLFTFVMVVFFPLVNGNSDHRISSLSQENLAWWNPDWQYRKLVTIDHTKVSVDLKNFPVLLFYSSDKEIAKAAQPSGQDIVFVLYMDNATILNHEIEYFNHTNGQLIAWVNVTKVSATSDTKLWMYYGNPLCGDQQHVEATWDSSYVLVQHLEETTGVVFDSTQYSNDGTVYGGLNQNAPGKMNGGYYFDGADDKVQVLNSESVQLSNAISIEVWSKATRLNANITIASKDRTGNWEWWFGLGWNNKLDFRLNTGTDRYGTTALADTNWHYLAGVYNGTHISLFVDGLLDNTPKTNGHILPNTGTINIGKTEYGGGNYYTGTFDELRISNTARNSSWVRTTYMNQQNPDSFISRGAEESYLYTLTLTTSGTGAGSIQASPTGPYSNGTAVTLWANASAGSTFIGFTGALTGTTTPQVLIIDENTAVDAQFMLLERYYSITITTQGSGTVTTNPTQTTYPYGKVVFLSAIPTPGWVFNHWTGNLTGNQNPGTLIMNANKQITAWFILGNSPPVAVNDSRTVMKNSSSNKLDVLANDYDPNGDTLTILAVTQPIHGVSSQDGAAVYYTPYTSYTGSDSFTYNISDSHGGNAKATVVINVNPGDTAPYIPNNPTPNNGNITARIATDVTWNGGDPDSDDTIWYDVYFGTSISPPKVSSNQSTLSYSPGTLLYNTSFYWKIVSWDDHGTSTSGPLWQFTTQQQEHGGIVVQITHPLENCFYLGNIPIFTSLQNTIVFGSIIITPTVTANARVDRVEFYIDGALTKTDSLPPYTYLWVTTPRFLKHVIRVQAYDTNGNIASDEFTVFKI
jgi:hypothetical protein